MEGFDFKEKDGELKKIQVVEVGGGRKILFVKGQQYMSWEERDQDGQRVAIAQLYECGIGTQEELAEAFKVDIKTVYNYINSFKSGGIQGLVGERSGPKGKWKLIPEMRAKILTIVLRGGIREYADIQRGLKDYWGKEISIASIRQVLLEDGLVKEKIKLPGGEQGYLFRERDSNGQLNMEFSNGDEYEINELKQNKEKSINFSEEKDVDIKRRSSYSSAQRIYLDQLKQGMYSAYAGGLLFAPLLRRYSFVTTIKKVMDIGIQEGYSLEELSLTLFYFDLFRFESMENFKTVYPEEFGLLLGRQMSPSIWTLRRCLNKVRDLEKSEELVDEFSKEYLKKGSTRWGVMYIDGHFLPYYGMYPISKGWHSVRKIPMKGSYNFLAVDEKFSPVLFLIRSSSEDLLEKIPEIILKAKKLAEQAGISKNDIKNLTVIFDREGYSSELFKILDGEDSDGEKSKIKFISWAKYSDKWVNEIEDEKFNKTATVTYEIQTPEEIKYFETEKVMKKYGRIRTIVVESGKNKKRAAIYTNDKESEAERIIQLICRRWGEENLIKELTMKHLINYSPGYEPEEIEEQPMVENPEVQELKQKRSNLKSELSQIKSKFGHEVLEEMEKDANWEEVKKKHILTIADIAGIRSQITLLGGKIDKLPQEIKFDEAHDGKKLVELNYEKKRFIDCIKTFTYHMEKKMCEILSNYYDKKKEIQPALAMIVRRGAYVKLEHGKLIVRLRRFKNSEIDYAARELCEDLNKMKPFTMDRFHLPISYELE